MNTPRSNVDVEDLSWAELLETANVAFDDIVSKLEAGGVLEETKEKHADLFNLAREVRNQDAEFLDSDDPGRWMARYNLGTDLSHYAQNVGELPTEFRALLRKIAAENKADNDSPEEALSEETSEKVRKAMTATIEPWKTKVGEVVEEMRPWAEDLVRAGKPGWRGVYNRSWAKKMYNRKPEKVTAAIHLQIYREAQDNILYYCDESGVRPVTEEGSSPLGISLIGFHLNLESWVRDFGIEILPPEFLPIYHLLAQNFRDQRQ